MRPLPSSQRCTSPQVRDEASERLNPPSDSTATRARSTRARSAACSAVSKPRPRLRGWTAVRAPAWRWGFESRPVPILSMRRARPGPYRAIRGRPTRGPW